MTTPKHAPETVEIRREDIRDPLGDLFREFDRIASKHVQRLREDVAEILDNGPADKSFALYQVARQLVEWDDRYGIENRRGGLLDRLRDCVTALDETYGNRADAIRQESAEKLLEGGAR